MSMCPTTYEPDMGSIRVKTTVAVESKIELPDGSILAILRPITTVVNETKVTILHIELYKPLEPTDLKYIGKAISEIKGFIKGEVVIISGRAPIWYFVYVAHCFHGIVPHVAVFDPKLRSAVIVMSHTRKFEEGSRIELPEEIINMLTETKTVA